MKHSRLFTAAAGLAAANASAAVGSGGLLPAAFLSNESNGDLGKVNKSQQPSGMMLPTPTFPPDSLDYNEGTKLLPGWAVTVELIFAGLWVCVMASIPGLLVGLVGGRKLTKAHKAESSTLILWLCSAILMFTCVLRFNSGHWTGARCLTLVEAVYLLAQILTTVGYGDITPAYPSGQVWVAINVVLALCLYGSLVMEVVDLTTQRIQVALANAAGWNMTLDEQNIMSARQAAEPLKEWDRPPPPIDSSRLKSSLGAFTVCASIGVLFWHYYPGEGKTWLQAVYMSIITLSTVGFGFFNAVTEGGKVFAAFWMLLGVAALAATITAFVDVMSQVKAKERRDVNGEKLRFFAFIGRCSRPVPSLGDHGMDSYDFLKFGVLLQELATEEDIKNIEDRFKEIMDPDGTVSCAKILEVEGPPPELLAYGRAAEAAEAKANAEDNA